MPESIDFMYIDANHKKKYVRKDLNDGYRMIKIGGVIGGHDFGGSHIGVIEAVLDFANDHDVELFTKHLDWWMVKKK